MHGGSVDLRQVGQRDRHPREWRPQLRVQGAILVKYKHPNINGYLSSFLACFMSYAGPPTSAQLTVESAPTSVAEGASVLLLAHNLPENLRAIFWYKGVILFKDLEVARYVIGTNSSVPGPAHSGRETMYSNGSLLLQNVTRNDAGFYTLRTLSTDLKAKVVHVQLQVNSK